MIDFSLTQQITIYFVVIFLLAPSLTWFIIELLKLRQAIIEVHTPYQNSEQRAMVEDIKLIYDYYNQG